jgi:hypothetical protein
MGLGRPGPQRGPGGATEGPSPRGVPAGPVISSLAGAWCIFSHAETEERWADGARRYREYSQRQDVLRSVMSLHDNWGAKQRVLKQKLAKHGAPEIDPEQAPYGQDWASGSAAGKEWVKTQRNVRPKLNAPEPAKELPPWRHPRNKYYPLEIPTEKARPLRRYDDPRGP